MLLKTVIVTYVGEKDCIGMAILQELRMIDGFSKIGTFYIKEKGGLCRSCKDEFQVAVIKRGLEEGDWKNR